MLLEPLAYAESTSAFQNSFEQLWATNLGGENKNIGCANLDGMGGDEVVADVYHQSSFGKGGQLVSLRSDGSQNWRFFSALMEDSFTTDSGKTIIGAGPYAEFVDSYGSANPPNGWKRNTRISAGLRITSQAVYAGDLNGDGKDDAIIGTKYGKKSPVISVRDSSGEEIIEISIKSSDGPYTFDAADITGDKRKEIIVGTVSYTVNSVAGSMQMAVSRPAGFFVYDLDGNLIMSEELAGAVSSVMFCDIEKDGKVEVVVGTLNSISVYNPSGARAWGTNLAGFVNDLDCADIDGDGVNEIVVGAEKTYVIKNGGDVLWSYNSGATYSVKAIDIGDDGLMEVASGSKIFRILDSKGNILYKSESFDAIYDIDSCDLDNDGSVDVVFGSKDNYIRAIKTKKYSTEITADIMYNNAEAAYTKKDYNATIFFGQSAMQYYDTLGKTADVAKSKSLVTKAQGYDTANHYYNISLQYFQDKDYEKSIEFADKAMEEYKKLSDLRQLGELSKLKNEAQMIPKAQENYELCLKFYELGLWENASFHAIRAKSAYVFLENQTLQDKADEINNRSLLYLDFYGNIEAAISNRSVKDYDNATVCIKAANQSMLMLEDPELTSLFENTTYYVSTRELEKEDYAMFGGLVVFMIIVGLFMALVGLVLFFLYKRGMLAFLGIGVKNHIKKAPQHESGLGKFPKTPGGTIGWKFKR